jgi:uncharacterized OsmC-like protein
MTDQYTAVVGADELRSRAEDAITFPHRWTAEGVTVEVSFTGAHLLHLSVAGCVLNDVYREAETLGIELRGVRVTASGGFDGDWHSTGIQYDVELATSASEAEQRRLMDVVDRVAEIPQAVRGGAPVTRVESSP